MYFAVKYIKVFYLYSIMLDANIIFMLCYNQILILFFKTKILISLIKIFLLKISNIYIKKKIEIRVNFHDACMWW